jgi:hypothetical protein
MNRISIFDLARELHVHTRKVIEAVPRARGQIRLRDYAIAGSVADRIRKMHQREQAKHGEARDQKRLKTKQPPGEQNQKPRGRKKRGDPTSTTMYAMSSFTSARRRASRDSHASFVQGSTKPSPKKGARNDHRRHHRRAPDRIRELAADFSGHNHAGRTCRPRAMSTRGREVRNMGRGLSMKVISLISVLTVLAIALGINGYYSQQNAQQKAQADVLEAVKRGEVVIDSESHSWKIKAIDEAHETPMSLELYIRNRSAFRVGGYVVFTSEIDTKGLEESFIRSFLKKLRTDGFIDEQLRSKKFAALGPKFRAVYNYLQRGEDLKSEIGYEAVEVAPDFPLKDYSFSFRQELFLKPGELKRITHEQDIPRELYGFLLKTKVATIEFTK